MRQEITAKSIFRRGRFAQAVADTRRTIVSAKELGWMTGDDYLVRHLQLKTIESTVSRVREGRIHTDSRRELVLPLQMANQNGPLHTAVRIQLGQEPDVVVGTVIPDSGREVYIHSYIDRLVQRLIVRTLEKHIDSLLDEHSHAYRPGRDRWTALLDLRRQVRSGHHWLLRTDVRRFFSSIYSEQALGHLASLLPNLSNEFLDAVDLTLNPPILFRRCSPSWTPALDRRLCEPLGVLLQGSVIAPLLSNVAGHVALDRPMAEAMSDVTMIRYSDDIMLAGRTPEACLRGLEMVRELVEEQGWALHPDKTTGPVDARREAIQWLGKEVVGRRLRTPQEKIDEYIDRIAETDPESEAFSRVAHWILSELQLDAARTPDDIRRRLRERSVPHAMAFAEVMRIRRSRRRSGAGRDTSHKTKIPPYYIGGDDDLREPDAPMEEGAQPVRQSLHTETQGPHGRYQSIGQCPPDNPTTHTGHHCAGQRAGRGAAGVHRDALRAGGTGPSGTPS